jgi:sugar lactone lactonase YvrE
VRGATVEVVVSSGLARPSGLALHRGRLFVTDNATNEIVAFDLAGRELRRVKTPARGIMGIAVDPGGVLWYVDAVDHAVVRLDPR